VRKACKRKKVAVKIPDFCKPKLDKSQIFDLELLHLATIADLSSGRASEAQAWEWLASCTTWEAAVTLRGGLSEIIAAAAMTAKKVVLRGNSENEFYFDEPEYLQARLAVYYMTELSNLVSLETAKIAADISEVIVNDFKSTIEESI
jgi:hypothetical protein